MSTDSSRKPAEQRCLSLHMGTGRVVSTLCLIALTACSPGRIAADGETAGDSGSGSGSESEDGPFVETETDAGEDDGNDDGDPWGGGCSREGSLKWLDICEEPDPCDSTNCEGDEVCLGGMCIAPKPTQACEPIELVAHEHGDLFVEDTAPLIFADIDGLPGDELITADDGVLQVLRAGELLASASLPSIHLDIIHPLQIGEDQHLDLLAYSSHYAAGYTMLLSGDGAGHFVPAQTQLLDDLMLPIPIDFDNDGDHDVLSRLEYEPSTNLYRNDAGTFAQLSSFGLDGFGVAVDFDLDGFVDDALIGDYPSPAVLLSQAGQLVQAGSLPEPTRGPQFQYGVGRPFVADFDGDGWLDVIVAIADGLRAGARIWWGQPGNTFAEPRDQLLIESLLGDYDASLDFIGVVDLDGVPPLELIVSGPLWVGYVRPAPAEQLPFGCFAPLYEGATSIFWEPTLGDLEGDGAVEIAIRDYLDAEVYTLASVP